jgi:hypothetical protein
MPSDFLQPLLDPTAPLPAIWPTGFWGAFLLFCIPIGGGIPLGVLMARDAGVSPLVMALMYLVSDVFMAVTHEPLFVFLGWLAGIVPALGKVRDFLARSSGQAGLRDGGTRGPLGLILFSFTVDPVSGRGAAAAAGHGFISGWTLAIMGDMIYFAVLMAATLWLSGMFGDERITVGVVLLSIWLLSWFIRRRQQQRADRTARPRPAVGRLRPALATANGNFSETAPTVDGERTAARASVSRPPSGPGRSKKARRKSRR